MAITPVASVNAAYTGPRTGATTAAIDTTGATLIEVTVSSYSGAGAPTLTDSKSNTWNGLTERVAGGEDRVRKFYAYSTGKVGAGHTFTLTGAGGYAQLFVRAYAGGALYESEAGNSVGGVNSISTGSVTPSANGALITTGITWNSGFASPVLSGGTPPFTSIAIVPPAGAQRVGGAYGDTVQTTAAALNPLWTASSAASVAGCTACYVAPPPPAQNVTGVTRVSTATLFVPAVFGLLITGAYRASTALLRVPVVLNAGTVLLPRRDSTAVVFAPAVTFPGYLEDVNLSCFAWGYTHTVTLDLTLADATLHSVAWGTEYAAMLDVVLDDATLVAKVFQPIAARMSLQTAQAALSSRLHSGTPPILVGLSGPRIYNVTGPVRASGGTILCFIGPPHRSVAWRLLQGVGTLTPFTTLTDELGRCSCRFDAAGITGPVVIGAAWVP